MPSKKTFVQGYNAQVAVDNRTSELRKDISLLLEQLAKLQSQK
jgi:hypothetical protein